MTRGIYGTVASICLSCAVGCTVDAISDAGLLDAPAVADGGTEASLDAPAADVPSTLDDAPASCTAAFECRGRPASTCVGEDEHSYAEMGTCVDGVCQYTRRVRTCPEGCTDGACVTPCGAPTLETVMVDGPPIGFRTSIAVDGAGAPLILSSPYDGASRLYERAASAWTSTEVPAIVGNESDLAVEADGTAHVVMHAAVGSQTEVFYARRVPSGAWVETGTFIAVGTYPAIAVGVDGVPHVTYTDGDAFEHAWREGGTWRTEVVPSVVRPGLSDLVVGADGTLYVAVTQHPAVGEAELIYAERTPSGTWSVEVAETGGDRGYSPSIAVDDAGTIHIAHNEFLVPFAIYYTYRPAGGDWATEQLGIPRVSSFDPRLALDPLGRVHVVFRDASDLIHAVRTAPDTWRTTELRRGGTGYGTLSFAIGPDGAGHVAFGIDGGFDLIYGELTLCP